MCIAALLLVVVAASACATRMTLAQELAWDRWKKCDRFSTIQLKEIRPDGQIWVTFLNTPGHELEPWRQCLREAEAEQARKRDRVGEGIATSTTRATPGGAEAPEWRPGDEWAFRWESPRGKGTFVWSVDRIETVAGTEFYVTKGQRYENYWRRSDLAFHMDKKAGDVEVRFTPPASRYVWPLTVGNSWEQTYDVERPAAGQVTKVTRSCAVIEQERVTVPAGVFDTFRVECRNKATNKMMSRRWYAPAAKNHVKEEEFFDYGMRERELIGIRVAESKRTATLVPDAAPTIPKSDTETGGSLRQAAESGDRRAMARLGFMYFTGRGGLAKDDLEAVRWFRKGADAGDGLAMAFLGASYWTGLGGLGRDEAEAVRWFTQGAGAGDGRAMALLGQAYLSGGGGLPRDEKEAVMWFRKGADAGDARAMAMLGQMYSSGGGGLARDEVAAVGWMRRAADAGDGFAMATLGTMHESGEGGLTKDEAEAVRWYRRGVEAGNGRAMAALGRMYATGRGGLGQNTTEAVRWYREGAGLADAEAMFHLGQAYESGQGVSPDREEAARWYRKAASLGFPDAFDRLAAMGEQP